MDSPPSDWGLHYRLSRVGVRTGGATPDPPTRSPLTPGTRVDVRNRYLGIWNRGFEVAECTEDGYRIRRLSDGSVLSELFSRDDVRHQRSRQGFWWH